MPTYDIGLLLLSVLAVGTGPVKVFRGDVCSLGNSYFDVTAIVCDACRR